MGRMEAMSLGQRAMLPLLLITVMGATVSLTVSTSAPVVLQFVPLVLLALVVYGYLVLTKEQA